MTEILSSLSIYRPTYLFSPTALPIIPATGLQSDSPLSSCSHTVRTTIVTPSASHMLMFRSHPYATTEMRYRQYIVEYNPLKEATKDTAFISCSAAPQPPAAAPLDTWHLRIGHLHCDTLEKLSLSAKGVQFSRTNMSHCETCSLAKAHQIVSCHPADHATKPLVYVHLDLIQVTPAYNNHCWVLHFLDNFSRMNFVYILATKLELTNAVK